MIKHSTAGILSLASATLFVPFLAAGQTVELVPPPVNPLVVQQRGATPPHDAPQWPAPLHAPAGAPNIILILVDDAGFSATSTFGGDANTPNFSKLAAAGLRYNAFGVNSICSPTRASLLSGRNNHEVHFGIVPDRPSPYPGYDCVWPDNVRTTIPEVLKDNGYATAAFGKWHNTPFAEAGPTGPFEHWPTSLGFEHFYGFLNGWDNQFHPRIFNDTVPVEPPATVAEGYNFTHDMTDQAIRWMHETEAVDSTKPFFLYFATGATHWPIQVPKEYIAKYKGKFDAGWDVMREQTFARQKALGIIPANTELTPRPPGLPAWDSLTPSEKKLLAHEAEVYAAYAEQADHEIGRLLDQVAADGQADNTLVIEIFGDNGGSAEGGLMGRDAEAVDGKARTVEERLKTMDQLGSDTFIEYNAAAWAWEQSTPFQGTKLAGSHLGGTRDAAVISWPARIHSPGELRTQFQHITDVAPTLFEAAQVTMPTVFRGVAQLPLEGQSLLYTFDNPNEPSHHHMQYTASEGNISIYKNGWWAGRLHHLPYEGDAKAGDPERHPWELYDLTTDYSQAHDLATSNPDKLKEMEALFDEEAKRNNVYPLLQANIPPPEPSDGRKTFVYRSDVDRLTIQTTPTIAGVAHTVTADIVVPAAPHGVIFAQGGRYGGFTLFIKDGHVVYEVNAFGNRSGRLVSRDRLKPGPVHIVLSVEPDDIKGSANFRPGHAAMQINGVDEGEAKFANLIGKQHGETLDIGKDLGTAVSPDYTVPFTFNGTIEQIKVQLN